MRKKTSESIVFKRSQQQILSYLAVYKCTYSAKVFSRNGLKALNSRYLTRSGTIKIFPFSNSNNFNFLTFSVLVLSLQRVVVTRRAVSLAIVILFLAGFKFQCKSLKVSKEFTRNLCEFYVLFVEFLVSKGKLTLPSWFKYFSNW